MFDIDGIGQIEMHERMHLFAETNRFHLKVKRTSWPLPAG